MIILVTGGAGFIGSNLSARLLAAGNEVIVVDNLDDYYKGKEKNIERIGSKDDFTFLRGDVTDKEFMGKVMKDVDIVYHLAAQPGVRISVENPQKTVKANILGTANVLKTASDNSVKKMIFSSSSSVFGKLEYMPIDEKHPKNPISPYGLSKLCCEKYCKLYEELSGIKTVILRYFTAYGPAQRPDMGINIFIRKAIRNEPITIFGDGKQTRDFTYVDDLVDAFIIMGQHKKAIGEAVNFGTGRETSILELANKIISISGSKSQIAFQEARAAEVHRLVADTKKARELFGWESRVNLEEGLKKNIEWVRGAGNEHKK